MFEKEPLFREVSASNMDAYREAKLRADRSKEVTEAQIERELAELDAAIAGMDAAGMELLRAWAVDPQEDDDASRVVKRPR